MPTMSMFDPMMNALQRVLDLRQQQHAVTASNLANAETPGFRAKVLEFDETLSAIMKRAQSEMVNQRVPGHVTRLAVQAPDIEEVAPAPWSTDDNSVLPEREIARMQENSLMYRAVAEGLSRRLALLKYAASDGR
ncbi:MAG: flagellar basal body rod protein FlgB [Myxococcota bacterium]